jgi:hypothetical protein
MPIVRVHTYPGTDESSWVSTNRRGAFPGSPGDDGLGFDFRVGSGRQPLMFEVKATQGQGGQIELGESEVRAAQQHAGHDRWRLLVITSGRIRCSCQGCRAGWCTCKS